MNRRLAFVLHDLTPWEGHSRSTLEIARRLSRDVGVDLYSFTFFDAGLGQPERAAGWGDARWFHIRPDIRKPFPLRASLFYLHTALLTGALPGWSRERRPLIHATGACTLISDVVQVQFLHAAWKAARAKHPHLAFPGSTAKAALRRLYHRGVSEFDIATEKLAYTKTKTYIAIAEVVKRELQEYYGIHDNVHVIHHGVDPVHFKPADNAAAVRVLRSELDLPHDKIIIAFVGALERKGLGAAIEAWAKLSPGSRAKAVLLAVGGGQTGAFQEQARRAGVADSVIFKGHTKDIRKVYQASDAFLLPTLYEPFGMVITEAMACGLPPIVTKLAGASELISDGTDGLLLGDPADTSAIAACLTRVIENEDERKNLKREARRTAERYTWDHAAKKYAGVLYPLLGI
ncbi:MAG TPA: glycosyltransferase family 4 protein [Bdellovibrionales bacterium]|nr:glycosyltransferase family 4 protein [Bdellovibrionales bacterium]